MSQSAGFTLIEIVVTIVIISTLSLILVNGYSTTRLRQALLLSQADVESLLKDAQKRALNEERDEACLQLFAAASPEATACSDVGVYVRDTRMLLFADTNQDGRYAGSDFRLREQTLPAGVRASGDSTFIFQAVPPTITLVVDGNTSPTGRVVLHAGAQSVTLLINPYGQVEVQ